MLYLSYFKTIFSMIEYKLNSLHVNAFPILYEYQHYNIIVYELKIEYI